MPNHSAGVVKQMLEQVFGTCDLTCMRHWQVPFFCLGYRPIKPTTKCRRNGATHFQSLLVAMIFSHVCSPGGYDGTG